MVQKALVLFVAITAGAVSGLDSDGYYCVGADYIAYQFGLATPSTRLHHLYVVRLGAPDVISQPDTVSLPQFQVHGLLCQADAIEVASWDSVYTVPLDGVRRPEAALRAMAHPEPGKLPERFRVRTSNLGTMGRPGRTSLLADAQGTEYFLEIEPESPLIETCTAGAISRIIAVDTSGQVIAELVVYEGNIYRECGH